MERELSILGRHSVDLDEMDICGICSGVLWHLQPLWRVLQAGKLCCQYGGVFAADNVQIAGFAYSVPFVGPYLAKALQVAGEKAGADERAHKDLPV